MWSLGGAAIAIGLAVLAALAFTPEPGFTPAMGFAGWPRLGLYALGGVILASSAPAVCRWNPFRPTRAGARAYVLVAIGSIASLIATLINVARLRTNMADPLGPALWIGAMVVVLGYMLFPLTRRIGWWPLWPSVQEKPERWRWTGPLILAALLVIAAALRLPDLADIPQGINPDEGDRASTSIDLLNGEAPAGWFDSGWFFINMIYFRTLAASLVLFGRDVAGGRMLSALVGIAFVGVIAWIGVRNFGWRTGLLATAFATGMTMTVQHSRLITEAGITGLMWAISIGGFLEGARTGRLWAWALAGISGGLGLYYYPSARLWAAGAVLTVLALMVHQRRPQLVLGIGVAGVASLVASAPFLMHLTQHPDELSGRYAQTAVLDPRNQERLAYLTPPEPLPALVALQVERTIGMFDRYPDGGGFLPTGRPIFGAPLAQLTLVGAVYLLVRGFRDPRLMVLSIWFWLGLSGVALTVETPDYLRSVGMLPSLCFILAIPLMDMIDRFTSVGALGREVMAGAVPAVVAVLLLTPEMVGYFVTFRTLPGGWGPETREGLVIASLGASGPVYSLEMNEHMVTSGWVKLLAPHTEKGRIPNVGREVPIIAPSGAPVSPGELRPDVYPTESEGFSVVFSPDPNQQAYVPMLQDLYPGAVAGDAGDGRRSIQVSADVLAGTRGVTVLDADGGTHAVPSFGEIPTGVTLPARLTWRTGVRFPSYGVYHLAASGSAEIQLRLDGAALAAPVVDVQAFPGVHFLELVANVSNSSDHVTLRIGGAELTPRQTYRLMDAPWGLQARLAGPLSGTAPGTFLDSTVSQTFFDPELGFVIIPNSIVWTGSLLAPRSGAYRMAFASEDTLHLQIEGQPVDVVTVKPEGWHSVGPGSQVQLSRGPHRIQVTLDISHGGRDLARWNWVPPQPNGALDPTAEWSVVPPRVLRPVQ